MSGISTISDVAESMRSRIAHARWIESPAFDGFLLIFAPLTILPIVLCLLWFPAFAGAAIITLAFAHYASSFVFYFWDENHEYFRARWIAFFAGPVIIGTIYSLLIVFEVPYFIQFMVIFWNTWHVARQNCGILSIYRMRAGVKDNVQTQRTSANTAIISISLFLTLWNIETFNEVEALFDLVSGEMTVLLKIATGAAAIFFISRLVFALWRRKESIGIPEALFLASSLAFFYPYLVVRTSILATNIMLVPHYVQYMALVWLLHRRKFGAASEGAPLALRRISANLVLLILGLFGVGFAFYLLGTFLKNRGVQHWFEYIFLLIAFTHFYIDGLNWAFKRSHMRQTMLPYLLPSRNPTVSSV